MQKRTLLLLLAPLAVLATLCAGMALGIRSVMDGGLPMEDGRAFAGGRIERVVDGYTSAFLIEEVESVVLVDSGMDPEATAIIGALARRGYGSEDVRAIVFTHGHGDHIGGARAFPQAELYALGPEVDLIEGHRVAGNLIGKLREPTPTGLTVTRALEDGETLRIGSLELELFAVPGHSQGSAAVLCEGALFLGDAAASTVDAQLAGPPPVFSADREAGIASLRALASRLAPRADEILWLLPSHQGALEGPDALLAWAQESP
jgi:hydroxyacylglutathione hydrolase